MTLFRAQMELTHEISTQKKQFQECKRSQHFLFPTSREKGCFHMQRRKVIKTFVVGLPLIDKDSIRQRTRIIIPTFTPFGLL